MRSAEPETAVGAAPRRRGFGRAFSAGAGVAAALLPKCPLCWALYGSAACGLGLFPALRWERLLPVLFGLFAAHLFLLGRAARESGAYGPFCASLAGGLAVAACRLEGLAPVFGYCGAVLIAAACLWDLLRPRYGLRRPRAAAICR